MLFAEKYARCGSGGCLWGQSDPDLWMPAFAVWTDEPFQTRPSADACDPRLAQAPFFSGLNVALADGSVRQVSQRIGLDTWWAACTPASGEVFEGDW